MSCRRKVAPPYLGCGFVTGANITGNIVGFHAFWGLCIHCALGAQVSLLKTFVRCIYPRSRSRAHTSSTSVAALQQAHVQAEAHRSHPGSRRRCPQTSGCACSPIVSRVNFPIGQTQYLIDFVAYGWRCQGAFCVMQGAAPECAAMAAPGSGCRQSFGHGRKHWRHLHAQAVNMAVVQWRPLRLRR